MAATRSDGRQARWDKHNEARRQQIIDAAMAAIEENEPGADVKVQQIAAHAGISRTVIYRHFEDRADLDRAVQKSIIESLWRELHPAMSLDGTVPQIIRRIVGTYVGWAVAHPALHLAADHDPDGAVDGPLREGMERIATEVSQVVAAGMLALGGTLSEEDATALDPLVFGLVGAVFGAVRRWLTSSDRQLSADALEKLVAQSVWFVVDGHARTFGLSIDPTMPVVELLEPERLTTTP